MMRSFFSREGTARHPVASSVVASLLTGLGATVIAYLRFANRDLPFAAAVGVVIGAAAFVAAYREARQPRVAAPTNRGRGQRLSPMSWFEALTVVASLALAVMAAVFRTWSFLVPAAIFGGLSAALMLMRYLSRRRDS